MTRALPEWIGRTPDTKIPPRVRLRIWERENGVCHICKRQIQAGEKWQADHVKALVNGGEHREANLSPAHVKCHTGKTAQDVAEKAKVAAVRKKHLRIVDAPKMQGKPFPKTKKSARREKRASSKPSLPPKRLFGTAIQEME